MARLADSGVCCVHGDAHVHTQVDNMYAPPGTDMLLGSTKQRQLVMWQHNHMGAYRSVPSHRVVQHLASLMCPPCSPISVVAPQYTTPCHDTLRKMHLHALLIPDTVMPLSVYYPC